MSRGINHLDLNVFMFFSEATYRGGVEGQSAVERSTSEMLHTPHQDSCSFSQRLLLWFFQIRERVEELRSMLGWILLHWRTQKQQWERRRRKEKEELVDNIYSETTVCSPLRPVREEGYRNTDDDDDDNDEDQMLFILTCSNTST